MNLLTLVTPRRVKLRNGRSGAYADVTFFMLDDEYTAMGLLPERDSSERALFLLIAYKTALVQSAVRVPVF